MNLIQMIKAWYNLYPDAKTFGLHKVVHLAVGFFIALIGLLAGHPTVAMLVVLVVAVGKEIADQMQGDSPLYAHVFDVLVTLLGGVLCFIVALLL